MKTIRRRQRLAVLALLCAPLLSGCQWFGGGKAELASSGITRDLAEDGMSDRRDLSDGHALDGSTHFREGATQAGLARLIPFESYA